MPHKKRAQTMYIKQNTKLQYYFIMANISPSNLAKETMAQYFLMSL